MPYKSKIDVRQIVKDHLKTLYNVNTSRVGIDDIFVFAIVPIVLSVLFYFFGFTINADTMDTIVSGLSIFVGLLFNALVLIIDNLRNISSEISSITDNPIKQRKLNDMKIVIVEVISNISFSIIISILAIIFLFIGTVDTLPNITKQVIDSISIFLLSSFILVFLMVLKRTYLIYINLENAN